MMNRRGFLGALLKFGAALALPKLPMFAEPVLDSPAANFISETVVTGTGLLRGLTFVSELGSNIIDHLREHPSDPWARAREVGAYRKNGEPLAIWALAPGGVLDWLPSSSAMAMTFTEREPVILRATAGVRLRAVYSMDGEMFMFQRDGQWGQDAVIDPTARALPIERPRS